jgi:hypothetical protein
MRKVLLSEDVAEDIIKDYIDAGFKPYFLSKRKIKKKDKKIYNKLRKFNIDPGVNLLFGVNDHNDFEVIDFGDPILDKLSYMGKSRDDFRILNSIEVSDSQMALSAQDMVKDVELRFVRVLVRYSYELKAGVSGDKIIPGTRNFCREMLAQNKLWSLEEIQSISTKHLTDMGLPGDVFVYKGGFWRQSDGTTSPTCRHTFKANTVIER